MDWNDRLSFGGDRLFNRDRVNTKGFAIYVYKYRLQLQQRNYFSCSDIGEGRRDHFVARLKAQAHHGDLEGICAIGAGYYLLTSKIFGEIPRKLRHDLSIN